MPQGVLPFQYEEEKSGSGMTALGGLPLYIELAQVAGVLTSIRRHLQLAGSQGWEDVQVVLALLLLQLAGGEAVADLRLLEHDAGFAAVLQRVESYGLSRRQRKRRARRWRKAQQGVVASPSAVFRYLARYHDPNGVAGQQGQAVIPPPTPGVQGLLQVNRDLLAWMQRCIPHALATMDMDATLIESHKRAALYCYQHYPAYQPLNVYWAEQGTMLHTEFRDGNVPAGYEQLRVLKEALDLLPPGVQQVRMRSDTAGYQWELLRYCAEGKHPRFGVIKFAVGVDVTSEFKAAVAAVPAAEWRPLERAVDGKGQSLPSDQEWAEVCFVPEGAAYRKDGPEYRFVAVREALAQRPLPGLEAQLTFSFPTITLAEQRYKLHGVVTNLDWSGDAVIWWLRERCGKGEEVHKVLKEDLAGGVLPSGRFGANAAWWAITMLAHNLHVALQRVVLGPAWWGKRLKAMRFALIGLPGRVVSHARQVVVRLSQGHPALAVLLGARKRLLTLARGSPG